MTPFSGTYICKLCYTKSHISLSEWMLSRYAKVQRLFFRPVPDTAYVNRPHIQSQGPLWSVIPVGILW